MVLSSESVTIPAEGQTPAQDQATASFRESKICIAVDVSGSTYGPTLAAEIEAIKQTIHDNITIIPWSDTSERPRPPSQIETLESEGGTDPNVLLEDPECRLLLQEAGFWFLMTDGEIDESLIHRFARNLTDYGMHGKACIISVFGEKLRTPSHCNISVGLSVFAVSPHVAFLYTDVETRKTSLLSTKGCFSNLLPAGKRNPTLDYDTSWADLPKVSYENLTRISVPEAQQVGTDEVVLQGNTRVSIQNLMAQKTVDEDLMRQIMLNEDNIKTIALTAKLKGESDKLGKWLDKVDAKLERLGNAEYADTTRSQLLKDAEARFAISDKGRTASLAHTATNYSSQQSPESHGTHLPMVVKALRTSSKTMRTMSEPTGFTQPRSTTISSTGFQHLRPKRPATPHDLDPGQEQRYPLKAQLPSSNYGSRIFRSIGKQLFPRKNDHPTDHGFVRDTSGIDQDGNLNLAIAGFLKPTHETDQFIRQCPRCKKPRSVLALLLRTPAQLAVTENFPPVNSMSKLVYPLTMGNYPETDIIADTLVCDSCALSLVKAGTTSQEAITAALPLVSYSRNQDAWLQTLSLATGRRFDRSDLPQAFLGILFTKVERLLSEPPEISSFEEALRWEANMIQSEVVLQAEKFQNIDQLGSGIIHEVLLRNFRDSLLPDKFPLLLSYPLDGFIVANAALSNSKYKGILTREKRKTVVLLRFLYHILESCHVYDPELLHAAQTLVQPMDDSHSQQSLFRWRTVRSFTFQVDTLQELRRYLSNTASMSRYRLSLTTGDLLDTPLLSAASLAGFRRLGPLFSWIEREAGHSIAVFVHYLMRLDLGPCQPAVHFQKLRERQEVKEALADPGALSARDVERLIKHLPVLE
ncbi:hypothetical protein Neosp_015061 [[Neocosmospora] mangrovei]